MATKLVKANKSVMAENAEEIKFYKSRGFKVPVKAKHVEKSMVKVKTKANKAE